MPRTCPIARLTVERPNYGPWRRETVAEWLDCRAEEIESEPNCYDPRGFKARVFSDFNSNGGRAIATFKLSAAGCLSPPTRKRIAKWLRSRAKHLRNASAVFEGRWFTQEFGL